MVVGLGDMGLVFDTGRELRAEVFLSDELPKHMMSVCELTQVDVRELD